MADPTPGLEAVVTATVTEMDAIAPDIGDVQGFEHTLDSEVEFIELFQDAGFNADIWLVDVASIDSVEGDAAGEVYSIYSMRIRFITVRKAVAAWSEQARVLFEKVRTKLEKNPAVFAIGGQRQLRTPETVSLSSHDFVPVEDQTVYEDQLTYSVEARRFA